MSKRFSEHSTKHGLPAAAVLEPDDDPVEAIEHEAMELRGELRKASRDHTREVLDKLKALSSRLPAHGRRARRSAGIIQTAITQAQQQLNTLSDEATRMASDIEAQRLFELGIYIAMSQPAKHFYNTIQAKKTYKIAPVTESGVVSVGAKKEIAGDELRQEFSMIEFHSMSEAQKKEVLHKTLRVDQPPDALVSNNPVYLRQEREGIAGLHRSLRHMEAYKAFMRISAAKGALGRTMLDISYTHDEFVLAHADVDALLAAYDRLAERPNDDEVIAQFRQARTQMKHRLKFNILERVLLGGEGDGAFSAMDASELLTPPVTPMTGREGKFADMPP